MRNVFLLLLLASILAACAGTGTESPTAAIPSQIPSTPTPEIIAATATPAGSTDLPITPTLVDDFFTERGITLPTPGETCTGLTQAQTEGPYYKADTPQKNSLLEEGMPGTRLILVGYVLDQNCQPLPNAWLDFWQTDGNGEYDNAGYGMRGHQFTNASGAYVLETIVPKDYPGRTPHIHVKAQPRGGRILTTQLFFPDNLRAYGMNVAYLNRRDAYLDRECEVELGPLVGNRYTAKFDFVLDV